HEPRPLRPGPIAPECASKRSRSGAVSRKSIGKRRGMVARPCPAFPIGSKEEQMFKGFRDFVLRGNVVDLAVAVVLGTAFTRMITALVESFLTPLIAAIGGKRDFSALAFMVNNSQFRYGDFINALVAFLSVAVVLYFL